MQIPRGSAEEGPETALSVFITPLYQKLGETVGTLLGTCVY